MKVDLKAKPYSLSGEAIEWVEKTIESMSDEEKVGQLFINLGHSRSPEYIEGLVGRYHIGGARYTDGPAADIYAQNKLYQEKSKLPLLIAANCEAGGNGASADGTLVATHAQCGACSSTEAAYAMGRISGIEATAVGCNWTFAPMVDILFNWRNTIVNTRSFGTDTQRVIDMAKAYMDGVHESNMLACAKHFPGDGVDERDHHLLRAINDLPCKEWENSFGRVYQELVDYGAESIMVGHIALPEYVRKNAPGEDPYCPASLSKPLLQGLLREKMGFNGLLLTDASHMLGMRTYSPRREQVTAAINAGCDMFLFFEEEDFGFMLEGYQEGIISEERMKDALRRILGLKAKLGLHKRRFTLENKLHTVGCGAHKKLAKHLADETTTLVKDTQGLLPVSPATRKRAKLIFLESAPVLYCQGTDPAKKIVIEELERAGFEVTAPPSLYELDREKSTPSLTGRVMQKESLKEMKEKYDVAFFFVHMKGYAQENNVRVRFASSHNSENPWWVKDMPTVCVSLNYTNHLYDLPMMQTFINAYAPTREAIRATIEKITGQAPFKGRFDESVVFCGSEDTRF